MTTTRCGIHLCDWTFPSNGETAAAALDRHEREDHPTAVRAREGLARWRVIVAKDSLPPAGDSEGRGRGSSAATAHPEAPRVHDAPSSGRGSAQAGSRPRRFCVYCGARLRVSVPWAFACDGCSDLDALDEVE